MNPFKSFAFLLMLCCWSTFAAQHYGTDDLVPAASDYGYGYGYDYDYPSKYHSSGYSGYESHDSGYGSYGSDYGSYGYQKKPYGSNDYSYGRPYGSSYRVSYGYRPEKYGSYGKYQDYGYRSKGNGYSHGYDY